jgi:RNA polymerase sigma-70 factor (ECF subfamily)
VVSKAEFKIWIDEYGDRLYAFALKRTASKALAEDLVQEAFISAYNNRKTFEDRGKPLSWLYAILRNKIIDHFRSVSRKPKSSLDDIENVDAIFFNEKGHWSPGHQPNKWEDGGQDLLERAEFMEVLEECQTRLSFNQRMAFVFKYMEGWTSKKICKELSITASNYWVLIHRAKLVLRECLEKNWIER